MVLGMTKIYKFQDDISTDALKELEKHSSLALDTEGTGLQIPHRDKLSLSRCGICNPEPSVSMARLEFFCNSFSASDEISS